MNNQLKPGDWNCPKCSDMQFARNHHCRRCGTDRPVRKDEWACPNCGDKQHAERVACRLCKTPKERAFAGDSGAPAAQKIRKGDWLCTSCNDVQFASRDSCRRCHASKPVPEDATQEVADGACLICMSRARNASLLHGDSVHVVTCMECATDLKQRGEKCPLCRQRIERVLRTFQ